MERYLLTSDKCPPCVVLHERQEENLFNIDEIEITDEEQLKEVKPIVDEMEDEIGGIPALLEMSDDGSKVSVGLNDVSNRLEELNEVEEEEEEEI